MRTKDDFEPEFTGVELVRLVLAIEAAIGNNSAGLTPLGHKITRLAEEAINADKMASQILGRAQPPRVDSNHRSGTQMASQIARVTH